MKNERFDTVEDLINSDLFCEWVQHQQHKTFWRQWQKDNSERQALIGEARTFLAQLSFQKDTPKEGEVELALNDIWSSIEKKQSVNNPSIVPISNNRKRSIITKKGWRIAASILFLIGASWFTWQQSMATNTVYATNYGETSELVLPDGSQVILQANSTLKVPKDWEEQSERTVSLEGEAFFKVTKTKASEPIKFIVDTKEFTVEVLGTQFNVLNRRNHKRVVLQEGKVQMQLANNKIVHLKPNEMIAYSSATKNYEKSIIQAANLTAWTGNKLILDNTPLSEIARMLRDNYGFEVTFSESVDQAQTRNSIGAIAIKNVEDLINITEASYEVEISKQDQQINIK